MTRWKTIDSLVRNELDANGTQRYADAANNSSKANVESGTDKLRSDELKIVLKAMRVADVPAFEDGLYRGIIHPLMEFDLLSETAASTFVVLVAGQPYGQKVAERGEIGTAFGIKLLRSTNIRADATSTNTYGNIFLGKDAFGTVDVENAGLKTIVKPLGSAGTEDPLNQRATVGYKFWFVPKVLEALRAQIMWCYGA
jgi:N4-gp56 family major capsid protein